MVRNLPSSASDLGNAGLIPGLEDPLEESMATHSSILAWEVPWTEEPGRLQSMWSQRVGYDRSNLAHMHRVPYERVKGGRSVKIRREI